MLLTTSGSSGYPKRNYWLLLENEYTVQHIDGTTNEKHDSFYGLQQWSKDAAIY